MRGEGDRQSHSQVCSVTRLRLDPSLSLLIFAGSGVWELRVEALLYRIGAEKTEEEGLLRIGTIRKILQDVDSSTMDTVAFS